MFWIVHTLWCMEANFSIDTSCTDLSSVVCGLCSYLEMLGLAPDWAKCVSACRTFALFQHLAISPTLCCGSIRHTECITTTLWKYTLQKIELYLTEKSKREAVFGCLLALSESTMATIVSVDTVHMCSRIWIWKRNGILKYALKEVINVDTSNTEEYLLKSHLKINLLSMQKNCR